MTTRTIYRDGEEIEVGLVGVFVDNVRRFITIARRSDWIHYFSGNGPGTVAWKKFTGFRQSPSHPAEWVAQWLIQVKGGIRPEYGSHYYRNIRETEFSKAVDRDFSERVGLKVAQEEQMLELYADPDCSCRQGFHWKCRHHGSWLN